MTLTLVLSINFIIINSGSDVDESNFAADEEYLSLSESDKKQQDTLFLKCIFKICPGSDRVFSTVMLMWFGYSTTSLL